MTFEPSFPVPFKCHFAHSRAIWSGGNAHWRRRALAELEKMRNCKRALKNVLYFHDSDHSNSSQFGVDIKWQIEGHNRMFVAQKLVIGSFSNTIYIWSAQLLCMSCKTNLQWMPFVLETQFKRIVFHRTIIDKNHWTYYCISQYAKSRA